MAQDTELQVIELQQLPIIVERLHSVKADIERRTAEATSLICTEETYKSVKEARAQLNKEFKEYEAQRTAIKNKILEPYNAFEQVYRECVTAPFQQSDAELKQKITDVTSGIVAQKTEALMDYYGELVEAADIDWLDDLTYRPKVNMSDSLTSLKKQAKAFVDGIVADVAAIEDMDNAAEIMVEYRSNLDLPTAIKTVADRHKALEEQRRREEERRARQAEREAALEEERMIMESFHNITELMFNLRREFVVELTPTDCKKGFPAIARYMACAADDNFDLDLTLIGNILGVELSQEFVDSSGKDWYKILDEDGVYGTMPEKVLLALAYSSMDSSYCGYWSKDWNVERQKYVYSYRENPTLDATYEMLTALGYEISDDEQALRDGTHKIFREYGSDEKKWSECDYCKAAHPNCDKCCKACDEPCNAVQACRKDEERTENDE